MADDISWDAPKEDIAWATSGEPVDHGLSARQKLSPVGKTLSPITSYPETYGQMNREAREQMSRGVSQLAGPKEALDPIYGAGNVALGGLNFIASPINAAYRSLIGQPVEDVTGIPREQTEFAAQLLTPGLGFSRLPKAPGTVAETMPKIRQIEGPDLTSPTAQRNRELLDEFCIPGTRGQVTEDPGAIRFEDMAARGAYGDEMQKIAKPAFEDQFEAIQSAGQRVGQTLSRGEQPLDTPGSAATSLNTEIAERAAAARKTRDEAVMMAEREAAEQRAAAARSGENIGAQIAGERPVIESPRQAGEVVAQDLREAAAQRRGEFRGLYDEFGRMEGSVPVNEVRGMGTRIRDDLSYVDNPVVIDDHLTPSASRAIQMLDTQSSGPTIQNRAAPRMPQSADTQIAGVTIQGIDRMRKHLVAYYKTAQRGSEDQRAVRSIINSFDGQIERAISEGLFSGDPRALDVLQRARASYSRYQREFHPRGAGDDVGTAMRRIVERNATPEETANMIIGSGKLGQAGLPVRIADRLEQILGNDSEAWNSIRQAIWQKASQVRSGAAGEIDSLKSARSVMDFAGSTLARRMFAPEEITAMRTHARGVRDLDSAIEAMPATQRAQRAQETYQQAFGGEGLTGPQRQVFQRMVEGTAQPEEVAQAMFSVIGGGNPANASRAIAAAERIVGADSPVMGSIRQGVWQKLTQNPFGKDQQGQQKLVQGINEFLNGKGRDVAKQLYSPEERALMQRYSEAVRRTIINRYARTNSDTAVASAAMAERKAHAISSAIASLFNLGPLGHLGGHLVAKKIGEKIRRSAGERNVEMLRESVADVIPKQPWTSGRPPRGAPSMLRPMAIPRLPQEQQNQ